MILIVPVINNEIIFTNDISSTINVCIFEENLNVISELEDWNNYLYFAPDYKNLGSDYNKINKVYFVNLGGFFYGEYPVNNVLNDIISNNNNLKHFYFIDNDKKPIELEFLRTKDSFSLYKKIIDSNTLVHKNINLNKSDTFDFVKIKSIFD